MSASNKTLQNLIMCAPYRTIIQELYLLPRELLVHGFSSIYLNQIEFHMLMHSFQGSSLFFFFKKKPRGPCSQNTPTIPSFVCVITFLLDFPSTHIFLTCSTTMCVSFLDFLQVPKYSKFLEVCKYSNQ